MSSTTRIYQLPDAGPIDPNMRFPVERNDGSGQTQSQTLGRLMDALGGGGGAGLPGLEVRILPGPVLPSNVWHEGQPVPRRGLPSLEVFYASPLPGSVQELGAEIWLFRHRNKKQAKRAGGPDAPRALRPRGWVHPADSRYSTRHPGSGLYGGATTTWIGGVGSGQRVLLNRLTEFACPAAPYTPALLNDFDPHTFCRSVTGSRELLPSDFPIELANRSLIRATRVRSNKLTMYFQFRIAIDNPDTTLPHKKIFGPVLHTLRVRLHVEKIQGVKWITGFKYQLI